MQINHTKQISYGATEHVPGNPFALTNTIIEEPVQPISTDYYMHGTPQEREY